MEARSCPPSHQLLSGAQTAPCSCVAARHLPAPREPKASAPRGWQGGGTPGRGEAQAWSRLGGPRGPPSSKNTNCLCTRLASSPGSARAEEAEGGQGGLPAVVQPSDQHRLGPAHSPARPSSPVRLLGPPQPDPAGRGHGRPPPAFVSHPGRWAGLSWGPLPSLGLWDHVLGCPQVCRARSWLWPNPLLGSGFSSKLGHHTASRFLCADRQPFPWAATTNIHGALSLRGAGPKACAFPGAPCPHACAQASGSRPCARTVCMGGQAGQALDPRAPLRELARKESWPESPLHSCSPLGTCPPRPLPPFPVLGPTDTVRDSRGLWERQWQPRQTQRPQQTLEALALKAPQSGGLWSQPLRGPAHPAWPPKLGR